MYTKALKRYFRDGFQALGIDEQKVFHHADWIPQPVDYIFVDECQDFSRAEIQTFIDNAQYCYFFGDSEQSIYGWRTQVQPVEETAAMIGVDPIELFKNYRLTKQNAVLAEYVGQTRDLVNHCEREGAKPQLFTGNNINEQLDAMINIIRNRNLTRVGILVPMNNKQTAANSHDTYSHISVEYVKEYLDAHGMPSEAKMSSDTTDKNELDFQSLTPKILTWTSAKGLQFNDVFIPFCENLFEEQRRKTLYVAITRAWNRLYIGYTDHINTAFFPPETSGCYEQMTTLDRI